jgi:hypothetical protein
MARSEKCECRSPNHGHEVGACSNEATETDRLCKTCHDAAAEEAIQAIPVFASSTELPPGYALRALPGIYTVTGQPTTLLPEHHPFYAIVGRVISEWSHVEHILDETIWGLLGASDEKSQVLAACVTSQIMGVGPRCKAILTLCGALGIDNAISNPFKNIMHNSHDTNEWRNRYVHDYWVMMSEPGKATQFRAMSYRDQRFGFVEISKDEIQKNLEKIRDFQKTATNGRVAVLAAFAALSKKHA